jgi:hypothetical protein
MRIVLLAIGGNGAPGRLILGLTARSSAGGSAIIRSDDDGATWTTVLNNTSDGDASDGGADVMISGLTIDQTNPDRVLASLVPWGDPRKFTARMMMSLDGGLTWTEISSAGMYYPQDVASGIDGKTMFVADGAGAWRAPAP